MRPAIRDAKSHNHYCIQPETVGQRVKEGMAHADDLPFAAQLGHNAPQIDNGFGQQNALEPTKLDADTTRGTPAHAQVRFWRQ
ncbi:hypothetical protein [uncultured Roseovarius sp.]|uniref:hypothetical protein n=1 Tax=uncultured Roseovarius sp. TaxID=293344 RepID=UPI00262207EA|nr:hypothetical protein [uncultured Roseovarius sp.]